MAQARKAGSAAYGWTWSHSDHLGSSTVIADNDEKVVRRLAYKAFGEEVVNSGTGEQPRYTYTGKERDASGLMYYGARYYDPALARFITPDTVSDAGTQGLNRYAYALNNPLKYTDPSGHAATSAYRAQTPYNIAPYAGTFDTGSQAADMALGIAGGLWNLGASLLNSVASMALGTAESGYNAVETRYNDLTYDKLGHAGIITTGGLSEDINALIFATTNMPFEVAYFKQSLSFWKAYSSGMVVNAGGKAKLWSVDPAMKAADEAAGVLIDERYIKNPTAQNLTSLITDSGKIGGKTMSGEYMYVVDETDNIIIGTRAGQRMPHPTLVGGIEPQVRAAGIIDIRGGRIYSINNASGHFKPGTCSLKAAADAFEQLPNSVFHKNFQGYLSYQ